ncbi:hypothetical protein K9L05_01195 [Candidatus Babeliales bacterium]|nr:hypothetical protein [Candidatus Babeliales bacterium]MCF7899246.1 hypothetical protein [Candidatus Babeliales bacterium]
MRPIKDAVFTNLVGQSYLPCAKVVSALFLIPIILLYSKLVDVFKKQQLFYIIAPCYGILFLFIAYFLANSKITTLKVVSCKHQILGWVVYLGVESFILLIISLFWSFVASTTDTKSAKRGYALIFAGAQIGTIAGPEFAKHATRLGIATLGSVSGGVGVIFPVITQLILFGSIVSFLVIFLWIIAAIYVGEKNYQLLEDGKIIE